MIGLGLSEGAGCGEAEPIGAAAAGEHVAACAAIEPVVAGVAPQLIGGPVAVDHVVEGVAAAVDRGRAGEGEVASAGGQGGADAAGLVLLGANRGLQRGRRLVAGHGIGRVLQEAGITAGDARFVTGIDGAGAVASAIAVDALVAAADVVAAAHVLYTGPNGLAKQVAAIDG